MRALGLLILILFAGVGLCFEYSGPLEPTNQFCVDNSTLYIEYIEDVSDGTANETYNTSGYITCPWGCEANECNNSTFDEGFNLLFYLGILLAVLFLAGLIAKFFL